MITRSTYLEGDFPLFSHRFPITYLSLFLPRRGVLCGRLLEHGVYGLHQTEWASINVHNALDLIGGVLSTEQISVHILLSNYII